MQYREEIETLVAHVKSWPMEDRVALAYEILRDMRRKPIGDPPRQTLASAIGIARGAGPVPSDEDVKRWIEEERLSKYGK
jgi:hypothetical protein